MECVFTSPVRTECGMFVMCCKQCLFPCQLFFIIRGCAVSRRYIKIKVGNSDVFSVTNMYLDHLQFCVVCTILITSLVF